ncbi:MAG: tetraacyldisaccharide 4'-kinase [Myxococcota bacterium]
MRYFSIPAMSARFWMYAFRGHTPTLWIHASSIGEVLVAARLVRGMKAPPLPWILTVQTPSGLSVARTQLPEVPSFLAPVDLSGAVMRCFVSLRPAVLLLIESELWPTLLSTAHAQALPVMVVNASLSWRSYERYRQLQRFVEPLLKPLQIWARSPDELQRFLRLGVPPEQCRLLGELKRLPLSTSPNAPVSTLTETLRRWRTHFPLLIAASTHPSEERLILRVVERLRLQQPMLRLLLVPRHPSRVANEQVFEGFPRCSERAQWLNLDTLGLTVVLDSVGELRALYPLASAVIVGGSFVPVGGHNVLEVAEAGIVSLVGPHTKQIQMDVEALHRGAICHACADEEELYAKLTQVLAEPPDPARVRAIYVSQLELPALQARLHELEQQIQALAQAASHAHQNPPLIAVPNPALPTALPTKSREGLGSAMPSDMELAARGRRFRWLAQAQRWMRSGLLQPLLMLLSLLFLGGGVVRRGLYWLGVFPQARVPARIISVGGLESGGVGKTPVVKWLAEHLTPVTILSRGYGGAATGYPREVNKNISFLECGDEPILLKQSLNNVRVVVDPQRVRAARWVCALESEKAMENPIMILDDGFQHHALARDLDIVVVRPQPPEKLLPRGTRREPLWSLQRAHIVWCHENGLEGEVDAWWRSHTTALEVRSRLTLTGAKPLAGGSRMGLEGLRAAGPLGLVTGIAHPQRVRQLLADEGLEVAHHDSFPDHHIFDRATLEKLEQEALLRGIESLVTTEKDAARLGWWSSEARLPWYVLSTCLEVVKGEEALWALLRLLGCEKPPSGTV